VKEELPTGWRVVSIDDIKAEQAAAIAIGPFGSRMKSDTYVKHGVPVIRGNNISETTQFTGEFVFITEKLADDLRSANVYPEDLVFPHRGAIGEVGIVQHGRYVLSTSLMKLSCNTQIVSPKFIFYFFRSPLGRHELLKNASTVGTPGIGTPLTSLKAISLLLPPLPIQRKIAAILGALDDKIELNRRINAQLETIAQALFKSWFVDFDPVKAKAAGLEPPGMDAETAALFPSAFQSSSLGNVPVGWRVDFFSAQLDILSGGTPKTTEPAFWGGEIPWVAVPDTASGVFITQTAKTITKSGLENSATQLLPAETIIITARGTVGSCALLSVPMAMNQSCYGLRGKAGVGQIFLYLQTLNQVKRLQGGANGSVFDTITRSSFSVLGVIDPPKVILGEFESFVRPLFDKILQNQFENKELITIRDSLLPKLLSGEIDVSDIDIEGVLQ
jgi:type I restriction enzyme, S subunit